MRGSAGSRSDSGSAHEYEVDTLQVTPSNSAVVYTASRNHFQRFSSKLETTMGSSAGDKTDLFMVKNFIDGEFVDCDSKIDSFDPSTGQVWAKIPNSGQTEVDNAVRAANRAFERSRIQEERGAVQYTVKEPIGVAGLISPWNLPMYLLTFKLAPALAAGNTVVAKPSELTSVTAFKLCEVMKEAGVPPGVVNMVFGLGGTAGHCLVSHPNVPLISFTGGTVTAERIRKAATFSCKKFSLELGGKNAAVVFEDADLDKCVPDCIKSSFMNQGEICLCTSRIFVHKNIYSTFLQRFVEEMKKLKVGDPREDVFMGALISKDHLSKVVGAIQAAQNSGATIHTQEGDLSQELPNRCKGGYFVRPTIITDVADSSAAMQEEIFGPVTCVVPFDTEEEVIARANGVKYGLCATVWTRDVSRAHRVSKHLKVGTVWVNCWLVRDLNLPFGGVKESGIGRESGPDSMEFFTEQKTVCVLV